MTTHRRRRYGILTLPTKKKALRAFVSGGKVYVVVNEKVHRASETYMLTFDAEELISRKLRELSDAGADL